MPANSDNLSADDVADVTIKGRMLPLNLAHIVSEDVQVVADQLALQLEQLPEMLAGMPLLLQAEADRLDLAALVTELRRRHILPAGVLSPSDRQAEQAASCGLPSVQAGATGRTRSADRDAKQAATTAVDDEATTQADEPVASDSSAKTVTDGAVPTKIVTRPIRSGQQIYAKGCDLIVTASVSAGAEVISDGSIHIYGALRGRALAGVQGNTQARIFCTQLGAELVSIAGHYRVAEDLNPNHLGRAVQIKLEGEKLITERQSK